MADTKLSDLAELTVLAATDLLLAADISEGESKKITAANLFASPQPIGGTTPAAATVTAFNSNSISDNGGAEALVINSDESVNFPLQPAFQAIPASSQDNIATGSDITIILGTERFDAGGNFASNTFTAPVDGKYPLLASINASQLDSASTTYTVKIVTSNKSYSYFFDSDKMLTADSGFMNMAFSALADMDANDTAHIIINQASGTQQTDIQTGTVFSGYLAT